ncbi:MAG: thiamine-phosphate kinase [Bdellovibrionales bacterium]|nr:thiamine-phosphate kinase [Bdellovibrionales bacterium]
MTKCLSELGEFEAIRRLAQIVDPHADMLGDDCAIFADIAGVELAVSSDSMVEGVHFRLETIPADALGWKLYASTISDLAAMGAVPLGLLVAVQVPEDYSVEMLEGIYRGLKEASAIFGGRVVGGDVTRSNTPAFCATAFGVCRGKAVRRSGAQIGDDVWVSGTIGLSAAGLGVLEGQFDFGPADNKLAVEQHRRPHARVKLGQELAERKLATSMIDVSDGLIQDAGHIAEMSRRTLQLSLNDIPTPAFEGHQGFDLVHAISGGEDYELLFTASAKLRADVAQLTESQMVDGVALTRIGTVREASAAKVLVVDASGAELEVGQWLQDLGGRGGFEHFS